MDPLFWSEVQGNKLFFRKALSCSALRFLLNFLVLAISCRWHQQFHFKWSFNIDIPPCLPFFLGLTFAWQMVQMAQQIFTGSVLERQSKAKQNKNTPAARLMTFWHHIMCHQSTGWEKHHRKIIDVELTGFLTVLSESFCLEQAQRASTRTRSFPFPSYSLAFSCCFGEKKKKKKYCDRLIYFPFK